MASRSRTWLRIYARATRELLRDRMAAPSPPRRIVLPHHSLLGDTVLLTAMMAKLREVHRDAEIVQAMPAAFVPLFEHRPYGVRALGWNPARPETLAPLFAAGPFDLAVINGDARFSWLARAMGAHRIVAFSGDRPAYKSWPVSERVDMPTQPMSWSEMVTTLIPGPSPRPYARGDWPDPQCEPFQMPPKPYAVLHVGASHVHKTWPAPAWSALAVELDRRGYDVCWSAGPGEQHLVAAIPHHDRFRSFAGRLQLTQLWHLLSAANLVVSGDTGVAHLARAAFAPTVVLFGPSSPVLGGLGGFWRNCPSEQVAIDPYPCRDQRLLFKREVLWVRRCTRGLDQCPEARCMLSITVDAVVAAIDRLAKVPAAAAWDAEQAPRTAQ